MGRRVVVEPQHAGEGLEDLHRGVAVTALFQAQVVVGADAGEHRDLFPPQARHTPDPHHRDTDLFGSDELTAGAHVIAQVVRFAGHFPTVWRATPPLPGPVTPRITGALARSGAGDNPGRRWLIEAGRSAEHSNRVPERVARLVYLDAMVPEDGESAADVMPMPRALIDLAEKSESGWRVPPLPELPPPSGLFGVTDPGDVAWLRSMLSDHPVRCLQQPVRLDNPAVRTIPRTHIHCVAGRPEGFARRPVPATQPNGTPAQVWELATGHDCMITKPVELAELLLKLG